jgi:hypothetical protein
MSDARAFECLAREERRCTWGRLSLRPPRRSGQARRRGQVRVSARWSSWPRVLVGRSTASNPRTARPCPPRLPRFFPLLQPNCAGGILAEQGALPDIPAKHRRALVARLVGDDALGYPGSSSRSRQTGPQRVTGHLGGVEPDTDCMALQHERHRLGAESCCAYVAIAVHREEGRSLGNARDFEPRPPGTHWAGNRVRSERDADRAPGAS